MTVQSWTGRLGLFLYPIPPLDGLSCLAVHILYIVNVNSLLMFLVYSLHR